MNAIKNRIVDILLKKYVLGYLIKGYSSLRGYKTQIFATICVAVYFGELLGKIPHDTAESLYQIFGSLGGMALVQKLQRYSVVKETVETVKKGGTK